MDLNLSKMPWYAQVGMFLVLSIAGTGVFWNFYAKPMQERLNGRRAELASIRAEIDKGLATARRLPEFREQVTELEAQLDRLRAVLPEEKDVADLLRRIQGMATQSNLTIRGFTPQPVATRTLHAEWPIGLLLEGTYHDLGGFLERVSKFPRIINVNGIEIRTRAQQSSRATITAECVATTFVLLDPARPLTPPGKPGAPARPGAAPARRPAPRTN